ncbi:MAG: hypothetical protein GXO89_01775 [Chlorobi bacterium]|nr:hypothetical protein [Chlorobiota bacterium]
MRKTVFIFLIFAIACSSPVKKKKADNKLKGDWAFLDKRGILTAEKVREFKEKGKVPEDLKKQDQ